MEITIRRAELSDMEALLAVYASAKRFMEEHGNHSQWTGADSVTREKLAAFLEKGQLFVGEDGEKICFSFAYIQGADPTYAVITDGAWLNEKPYGTIHRLASDGSTRGVVRRVTAWALVQNPNLRIDTHHDNLVMQTALDHAGFTRCGIIYLPDGDPRIAYQKIAAPSELF